MELVEIRDVKASDAAGLGRVHADSWSVAYKELFAEDFLRQAVEQRRQGWASTLADPWVRSTTLLVAAADTGIVAFLHGGPSQDVPNTQEVFGFYAHPEHWGTGVAATLMQHGVERLAQSGYDKAVLWTLADAGRARRFYEKAGWRLTAGQRTRDFGDGRELALMQYQRSLP